MSDDLKPCPFCGGANLRTGGDDKTVGVWCLDCEAVGPNHYVTGQDWNNRADRIEELSAKLALAIETIDEAVYFAHIEEEDILKGAGRYRIAKAMRELGMDVPDEWIPALDRMVELTGGKDE